MLNQSLIKTLLYRVSAIKKQTRNSRTSRSELTLLMKHPALPSKICTKDHRLGWVGGGRRSDGPILPFHLAPDQPQPQLDICNLCGFHGAFLPSSMLIFVFRSMPFTASHTVKVISLPFPRHSHPDLDIPHHPLPSSRNSHPGPLPLAWR